VYGCVSFAPSGLATIPTSYPRLTRLSFSATSELVPFPFVLQVGAVVCAGGQQVPLRFAPRNDKSAGETALAAQDLRACLGRMANHRLVAAFSISMRKLFCADFLRSMVFGAAFIASALPCIATPAGAQASSAVSENVGKYVRSEVQRQHIPGLALLVARGGESFPVDDY
jgi:hypothetical protein